MEEILILIKINYNIKVIQITIIIKLKKLIMLRTQMDNARLILIAHLVNVKYLKLDCSSWGYC